jgi:hypothetical protein
MFYPYFYRAPQHTKSQTLIFATVFQNLVVCNACKVGKILRRNHVGGSRDNDYCDCFLVGAIYCDYIPLFGANNSAI